jgi:hypothetical protein
MTIGCGFLGMGVSLPYLTSNAPGDVFAGSAGFVAGSVLIGAGTIALAILSAAAAWPTSGSDSGKDDRL